jgi:hypothetical protein
LEKGKPGVSFASPQRKSTLSTSSTHPARAIVASANDLVARDLDASDALVVSGEEMEEPAVFEVPDSDRGVSRARDGNGATLEDLDATDGGGVALEDVETLADDQKEERVLVSRRTIGGPIE